MSQEELDFGPAPQPEEEDPRGQDPFCTYCRKFVSEDHEHTWIRHKYLAQHDVIMAEAARERRRKEREEEELARKKKSETEEGDEWWRKIYGTGDGGGKLEDEAPEG